MDKPRRCVYLSAQQEYFCAKGWTAKSLICPRAVFARCLDCERGDRRSVKSHLRGETERKTLMARCSGAITKRKIAMKLTTIALAAAFALSSTFALAQAGGTGGSAGGSATGGASMSGSGTGTTTGGTTGTGSGNTTSPAVQSPNNPMNPSGNTLAPNGSPSGSTLGPTGPGSATGR